LGALALILGVSFYSVFEAPYSAFEAPEAASHRPAGNALIPETVLHAGLYQPSLAPQGGNASQSGEGMTDEDYMEGPRRVVARLIRAALASPENQAAWTNLATTLGGIEGEAGQEDEGMLLAAHVADSVAAAVGGAQGSGKLNGERMTAWLDGIAETILTAEAELEAALEGIFGPAAGEAWFLPILLCAPLISLLLLRGFQPNSRRARMKRRKKEVLAEAESEPATINSLDAARAMWSTGIPPSEIARKTGLAQDALSVMASLNRSPGS
jgi:hypothetical protein